MHLLQRKILDALGEGALEGATLRRIGEVIGEASPQKVKHHLVQLQRRGLVEYDSGAKELRMRQPEGSNSSIINIRIVGAADCGPATRLADARVEGYLPMSTRLLGSISSRHLVAVRAMGQSMNRANIDGKVVTPGDYLIVDLSKKKPKDGEYVLSTIDGACNVKKIKIDRPNQLVYLYSESTETIPPIVIHSGDDYRIEGTVIRVIKVPA